MNKYTQSRSPSISPPPISKPICSTANEPDVSLLGVRINKTLFSTTWIRKKIQKRHVEGCDVRDDATFKSRIVVKFEDQVPTMQSRCNFPTR